MARFLNGVAFSTPTIGTGTMQVGAPLSAAFLSPDEAGAENGDNPIPYVILDGTNSERGYGTYNAGSPATLSRDTVLVSKIAGVAGTSKISLSGGAVVRFVAHAEDLADAANFGSAAALGATTNLEEVFGASPKAVRSTDVRAILVPAALAIVSNDVAVNLASGRRFTLTANDDFELQLPTNCFVGLEYTIDITYSGAAHVATFQTGHVGSDNALPAVNDGDGEVTSLHFEVTAVSGTTATEVRVRSTGGNWGDGS